MTTQSAKWLDLLERCGWTFVQALAATIYAAGAGTDFTSINWPVALTGAAIAALLAILKVAGVNASQSINQIVQAAALIKQQNTAQQNTGQQDTAAAVREDRAGLHQRAD